MSTNRKKPISIATITATLLVALVVFFVSQNQSQPTAGNTAQDAYQLRAWVLDVGQGDSILLASGGQYMLVDAGENDKGDDVVADLKALGVEKLAAAVGTHPHSDHIGGLDTVLDAFPTEKLYMPAKTLNTATFEDVLNAADRRNLRVTVPKPGDEFALGEAAVRVIWPPKGYDDENTNNCSIVLLVSAGGHSMLLTGDMEKSAEKQIVKANESLRCDVIKVPHHGSDTSSTKALLDVLQPQYAVISVGKGNDYGHPDAAVVNRYVKLGTQIHRTDEDGTVIITIAEGKLSVQDSK